MLNSSPKIIMIGSLLSVAISFSLLFIVFADELVLRPNFATYISENNPRENYRYASALEVDGESDRKEIILQFSGNSFLRDVRSVDLVLECVDASYNGGSVYESDEQISRYVTWRDRDDYRNELNKIASIGRVYDGRTKSVDVSDIITWSGRLNSDITLVIRPESRDGAQYKRSSIQLIVKYGGRRYDDDDDEKFQLMMYWEPKYFWQESYSRKRWCAACGTGEGSKCRDRDYIRLVKCDKDSKMQLWRRDGDRFCSVSDNDLCWDYRYKDITLRRKRFSSTQDFDVSPSFSIRKNVSKDHRFEIQRSRRTKCITNLHHPKKNEKLMSRDCRLPRRSNTNYYVAVVPKIDGH